MGESTASKFFNRALVAIVIWLIVLAVDFVGGFFWAVLVLFASMLALKEYIKLFKSRKVYLSVFWIRISILAFMLAPISVSSEAIFLSQGFLLALFFTIILLRLLLRTSQRTHFDDVSSSIWSIIYLGLFPSFYIWIRQLDDGFIFIIILIMTVAMNDIACMLYGKYFGRTPLSPQMSPKKTVEGSIAGLLIGSLIFAFTLKFYGFNLNQEVFYDLFHTAAVGFEFLAMMLMGAVICLIAQIGDLVESLFKREAGVKDSGTIFQSHGGVLDRLDSHFFSAWIAYFVFYYLIT